MDSFLASMEAAISHQLSWCVLPSNLSLGDITREQHPSAHSFRAPRLGPASSMPLWLKMFTNHCSCDANSAEDVVTDMGFPLGSPVNLSLQPPLELSSQNHRFAVSSTGKEKDRRLLAQSLCQ